MLVKTPTDRRVRIERWPVPAGSPTLAKLAVVGVLDGDSVSGLCDATAAVMAGGKRHLRLDLSGVTSCDNAGLYTLLGVQSALRSMGGSLVLLRPSMTVHSGLRAARLHLRLVIAPPGSVM
ncbi:STAS domain-containing protein [Streptomyces violens]|uniref:STAS domain-containing protein n=1 Tax=Streptomyces violens TaxID=66377 RepID=UPI0004C0CC9D|nr:STAS domain-containing protein [Streptomyces violens]